MKDYIQEKYFEAYYDASRISLERLRPIIQEAWDAVPDEFIEGLLESWWRRCQAVIDAQGGSTKYWFFSSPSLLPSYLPREA